QALGPSRRAAAVAGAAEFIDLDAHQCLREVLHHRPQQVRARLLELLAQPARDVHRGLDHRAPPRLVVRKPTREDDAVVSYHPPAAAAPRSPTLRPPRPPRRTSSTRPYTTTGDATRPQKPCK